MSLDNNLRILLVEDAATMRKMEIKILKQLGFDNVQESENGDGAISALQSDPNIQLVISDWSMPEKDGMELLQWIRAHESLSKLPFIMATGQGDKEHVGQAIHAGASAVVTKPFSPDELKSRINEIFGVREEPKPQVEKVQKRPAGGKDLLRVAHIQITDHLTLGVLKDRIGSGAVKPHTFDLETACLPSWNLVQSALEKSEVDAAFILAPAAMDLFNYDVPIRLVMFAHRNGSIIVRNRAGDYRKPYQQFFKHKTFYIPFKMSIHNMLAHRYFSEMGLKPGLAGKEAVNVLFDVVAPINMPEFLADNPNACGFMVAEPIGSRAIAAGIAERQILSGEIWENHPCCVVVFRDEVIQKRADAVYEFTRLLADCGRHISADPGDAAEIAVRFLDPQKKLGLDPALLRSVLTEVKGIRTDNLFPVLEDLDTIQRYMFDEMGIGRIVDLEKFVDTRFAAEACKAPVARAQTGPSPTVVQTAGAAPKKASQTGTFKSLREVKALAGREGKYLIYTLAEERYGASVLDVREIIQMPAITAIPKLPPFVKGVINLRGSFIPIIDLRLKFGMEPVEYTERMCVVVVEIASLTGSAKIGIAVDSVIEVQEIRESTIQDTPSFGTAVNTSFITGLAKTAGGLTILMDIDKVLTSQEASKLVASAS